MGNGGGGALAHFEGSYEGLTLTSSETYTDLPNPSALVYTGLAGVLVGSAWASRSRRRPRYLLPRPRSLNWSRSRNRPWRWWGPS